MRATRLLAVVLALIAGCASGPPPRSAPHSPPTLPAPQVPKPYTAAEQETIEATVVLYGGSPGKRWITCAGVHVSPTRILTANHCLDGAAEWDGQIWYRHHGDALDGFKPARMTSASEYADLGLVTAFEPWPHYLDLGEVGKGDAVFAVGHPKGIAWHLTTGAVLGTYDNIDMNLDGRITVNEFLETDVPIKPGNSGGPLVNGASKLVGIASFYRPGTGLTYFVSWREIVSFLAKV